MHTHIQFRLSHASAVICALIAAAAFAQPSATQFSRDAESTIVREAMGISSVGRGGRVPVQLDAIQAQVVRGAFAPPAAGDEVALHDGSKKIWKDITAGDDDGWFRGDAIAGGYVCATVDVPDRAIALLSASGHGMVYVNGEPRGGDVYALGFVELPIELKPGKNTLLFLVPRGQLRVELKSVKKPAFLSPHDITLPDLIRAETADAPQRSVGGMIVVNASNAPLAGCQIEARVGDGDAVLTPLPPLGPLSARKACFDMPLEMTSTEDAEIRVALLRIEGDKRIELDVQSQKRKSPVGGHVHRTFRSEIDGSAQYYTVRHAAQSGAQGLLLTLHGASVEAGNQTGAYAAKDNMTIVAPTNRRKFGFDWEDWGRLDMLEVLALAKAEFKPQTVWLSGHSMGGHGTWINGMMFPDQFAAIAPSAGWVSFWSYAGGSQYADDGGVRSILRRAQSPSDTLALLDNARQFGVYVLHGDADDNVPVEQARTMRSELAKFHRDFAYYEQPGAGHWWGNECVDWPQLIAFLEHHRATPTGRTTAVRFTTSSPHVSSKCHWAAIELQQKLLMPSKIDLRLDAKQRKFSGTTENVARLRIDLGELSAAIFDKPNGPMTTTLAAGEPISVELDGQSIADIRWPATPQSLWFVRTADKWSNTEKPSPLGKGPHRDGMFKEAFRNRFVFVFGTRGSAEENAWAAGKARFDAETWWYRANGSVEIVADRDFDPTREIDRNVILYGHREMNSAWDSLIEGCHIDVRDGVVSVGKRDLAGDDLACLLIFPRRGSDVASVGVIAGSGLVGMRATDRLPIFLSGAAFPDFLVMSADYLSNGEDAIRATGFFDADWKLGDDVAWGSGQ
ncbi:MAG: prolyl oligopeptidase family serine peptidase [Phycisphaerae bacterium]